jgi:hypothetical protein
VQVTDGVTGLLRPVLAVCEELNKTFPWRTPRTSALVAPLLACVVNFSRFKGIECKIIQRYNPTPDLLRLYVYGYLNRIGSSRRLEREVGRRCGVDVVTLVHDLRIDYRFVT